jgi:hypothetical protein
VDENKNIKDAVGLKTFKLYDKDIKRPSKSRETVPLICYQLKSTNKIGDLNDKSELKPVLDPVD